MTVRPPPDPTKLLSAWDAWERGEELPGRSLANLKTGGMRALLEVSETGAPILEAWMKWEKAQLLPADALAAMRDAGIRQLIADLASV
jgi:hypothetical protein